jgi:hypothetical protein
VVPFVADTLDAVDGLPVDVQSLWIADEEKNGLVPVSVEELFDRVDEANASNVDTIGVYYDGAAYRLPRRKACPSFTPPWR